MRSPSQTKTLMSIAAALLTACTGDPTNPTPGGTPTPAVNETPTPSTPTTSPTASAAPTPTGAPTEPLVTLTATPGAPTAAPTPTAAQTPTTLPTAVPTPTAAQTPTPTQVPTAAPTATDTPPTPTASMPTATLTPASPTPATAPPATPTSATPSESAAPTPTWAPTPALTPTPVIERDSSYYYDPDRLLEVVITMDPDDYAELVEQERYIIDLTKGEQCRNNPPVDPYTWFEADVVIDGTAVDRVGISKKGFFGSASKTKPGLKLKFDSFVDGQELDGMERLTFNNSVQDPSFIHQCMAYAVFTQAGMPAPRCSFARLTLNGQYLGIYVNVEPIKKDFLKSHFANKSGDLYEGTLADFRDAWTGSFEAKTSDTDPEFGPIFAVTEAAKAQDEGLLESLGAHLDVDNFITYWALEILIAQEDSYSTLSNNYFVYREPQAGLMYFIPWGTDNSMHTQMALGAASILPYRLWNLEQTRALYIDRLMGLLDTVWHEEDMLAEADRMEAMLSPHVPDPEGMAASVEQVRAFVRGRRAYLESVFGPEGTPPSDPAAPRDGFCWPYRGQVELTFSTSWQPTQAPGVPNRSRGTLRYTWNNPDAVYFDEDSGVLSGTSALVGDGSDLTLTVIAQEGPTTRYTASLFMTSDQYALGTHPYDGHDAIGYLTFNDLLIDSTVPMGAFMDGEITFDQVSTQPGGAVSGSIHGDLYGIF